MTVQEAYIQGFRKTAEAHGADPVKLSKLAMETHYEDTSPEFRKVFPDDWESIDTALPSSKIKHQLLKQKKRYGVDGRHRAKGEAMGSLSSILGSTALGSLLGALAARKDRGLGAVSGGLLGGGSAVAATTVLAPLIAAIRRRRTEKEQAKHDKGSALADYLIPGVGAYNGFKRQGRASEDFDSELRKYYGKGRD